MILLVLVAFLDLFVPLFSLLVLARVILSYVVRSDGRVMGALLNLTEPLVGVVRRVVPAAGGFDFAPLVTLLLLQGLQYLADGLVRL